MPLGGGGEKHSSVIGLRLTDAIRLNLAARLKLGNAVRQAETRNFRGPAKEPGFRLTCSAGWCCGHIFKGIVSRDEYFGRLRMINRYIQTQYFSLLLWN
jgi:hypothetical protein